MIGVGSNFCAESYLPKAVKHLEIVFGALTLSNVYKSHALKKSKDAAACLSSNCENDYLNMAVSFSVDPADLAPKAIIKHLKEIEYQLDRRESSKEEKQVSMDLDLLLYGNAPVFIDGRYYPAKEELNHSFVLAPLADIAGHKCDPYCETSYSQRWKAFDKKSMELEVVNLQF